MTNTEFDKDKVLGRVKKMLALANDAGASEGERDNALRMAHATLAKYNLSMADADNQTTGEKRLMGDIEYAKDSPWKRTVANAIASLFFCNLLVTKWGRGRITYHFIGKESNVYTAKAMTQYVCDSIYKEATRAARSQSDPSYHRSFCKGAAHRVYRRCEEIREQAERSSAQQSSGTALVLASLYQQETLANRALINQMFDKVKSSKSRERGANWDAYSAGRAYGDKIGLHTQVGGKSNSNNGLLK
jgi:hypothetical protein